MNDFWYTYLMILEDTWETIRSWYNKNIGKVGSIILFFLPYATLFIGEELFRERKTILIGSELLFILVIQFVCFMFKKYSDKKGKGSTIPVPKIRFTEEDEDGEISIRNERIQELILYMDDLENYFERKHMS